MNNQEFNDLIYSDELREHNPLAEFHRRLVALDAQIQDNRGKVSDDWWNAQFGVIANVHMWFKDLGLETYIGMPARDDAELSG